MPEAHSQPELRRSPMQRFKTLARASLLAVCVSALALPAAHAATTKKPAASAKKTASADKRSAKASSSAKAVRTVRGASAKSAGTRGTKAAAVASSKARVTAAKSTRAGRNVTATVQKRGAKTVVAVERRSVVRVANPAPRLSYGQLAGLHQTDDALDLSSSVALVVDQETHEVLLSKNDHAVLPIASLTKLMTGVVISEARLPLEELITITQDDVDTEKGSRSRLAVGSTLTRGELLHLALMSSENRAAHALGRTYPGGLATFVSVMNAKARQLGMNDTRYVEPTGLSPRNQSTAQDLAVLVSAASRDPLVRQLSVSPEYQVAVGNRTLQYSTTNRLVRSAEWDIGLQKTGYISEAGQCLVMQAKVAGRKLIMVFLDSGGRMSRLADAERVRRWVEASQLPTQGLRHLSALAVAGE